MKILKMPVPVVAALCLASVGTAQAAPKPVKAPFPLFPARITGGKVSLTTQERDAFYGAERIASRGDRLQTIQGSPRKPLQLELPWLHLSTQTVYAASGKSTFYFSGSSRGPKSKLKFTLAPRSGGSPVVIEAECFVGSVAPGKVTLEDTVSGFYQDASGRHELKGDIVTLSAFDNAISIVQDGDITLSDSPAAP